MSELKRILNHYDGVLNGDAWHGDAIWKILEAIPAQTAAARPLSETHTIWELVSHMTFWEGVVTKRLAGLRAGLVEELNFPPMPVATEENWQKTLNEFRASNHAFREALAKLDPAKLEQFTAAGKRTYYDEAHGIIEHHVYHLGQIAILKKALDSTAN
jgi:uncharacterized damage-inducible protein DinB